MNHHPTRSRVSYLVRRDLRKYVKVYAPLGALAPLMGLVATMFPFIVFGTALIETSLLLVVFVLWLWYSLASYRNRLRQLGWVIKIKPDRLVVLSRLGRTMEFGYGGIVPESIRVERERLVFTSTEIVRCEPGAWRGFGGTREFQYWVSLADAAHAGGIEHRLRMAMAQHQLNTSHSLKPEQAESSKETANIELG